MLSQETIEKIKAKLVEEKIKILKRLQKETEERNRLRDKQAVGDEADSATQLELENISNVLSSMDAARLRQIEEALRRIEEGTYGLCEVCGEPIEEARLLAQPFATKCIYCLETEEKKRY
ncbi:MAG: TraR/DksA family transcriptional regulator [Thermosulfidibacteraceae bacterium]